MRTATLSMLLTLVGSVAAASDGSQYAALSTINRDNVADLEVAFEVQTGDLPGEFKRKAHSFQATPLYHGGLLFISTSSNEVIAYDAGTGDERWRFDPALPRDIGYSESASRGVALWLGDAENCPERIFHGTLDGRLFALDARSGKPCAAFGEAGSVDLGRDIRNRRLGEYSVTSPVAVLDDRIIVGSSIGDNGAVELEQGIVRALDPVTGRLLWQWDPIPRDSRDSAASTWGGESARRTGAANAWAPISVDPERRLVFIPTSSPSPDFYGGERIGENRYANSLVAMHADTGEVAWHRQLVHHDIWDYDVPMEPSLTHITRDGEHVPAVVVATKTGMLFAFHRESGEPLLGWTERPVPQDGVPGEAPNPTQPFSDVVLVSHEPVTEEDAFGLLGYDRTGCEALIREYRSEGIFTPPSLEGTIEYPGWAGGANWGGVALDESRQVAIVNTMNLPGVVKLLPRETFNEVLADGGMPGWQMNRMTGTPYGMARRMFVSELGLPCTKPPWGHLAAVDLAKGEILWQIPFGTVEDLSPVPMPGFFWRAFFADWGAPNIGGPMMTATGLVFIGASLDYYFRVFDVTSGEELWRYRLPTSANSTPISYEHEGRQYVAVSVGGHSGGGTRPGDSVFVFALPE